MKTLLKHVSMYLLGYKKVPLKDTKGVLTKNNNFKWVKETDTFRHTEFPSGTRVDEEFSSLKKSKTIKTRYGAIYNKMTFSDGSWRIIKAFLGKNGGIQIIKEKSPAQAAAEKAKLTAERLTKKRLAFIDNFNKKFQRTTIRGEDGTVTKLVHDKETNDLVHWFRKDGKTGNKSVGDIEYIPFGKIRTVTTNDQFIIDESIKLGNLLNSSNKTALPL